MRVALIRGVVRGARVGCRVALGRGQREAGMVPAIPARRGPLGLLPHLHKPAQGKARPPAPLTLPSPPTRLMKGSSEETSVFGGHLPRHMPTKLDLEPAPSGSKGGRPGPSPHPARWACRERGERALWSGVVLQHQGPAVSWVVLTLQPVLKC